MEAIRENPIHLKSIFPRCLTESQNLVKRRLSLDSLLSLGSFPLGHPDKEKEDTKCEVSWFSVSLAAGLILLQAQATEANTLDVYTINVDENGNGTYVETDASNHQVASGTLPVAQIVGGGLQYTLPYEININGNSNQWLTIYDPDGQTKSDMINWQNLGGQGLLDFYSGDTGQLADVGPIAFPTFTAHSGPYGTQEDVNGLAFYSTYIDTGGVPGDPAPHPTIEAYYYFQSGAVPEPTSLALFGSFAGIGLIGWVWRRRDAA